MSDSLICPLCTGSSSDFFTDQRDSKVYYQCNECELIWMRPCDRPTAEEELAHYKSHNNNPTDPDYRRFLSRLWTPLREQLSAGAKGLDYGSGPGPTLHLMAQEDGFSCDYYDPYFHPAPMPLETDYDFITCSETAEHFYSPQEEFEKLCSLLKPGGWLGMMTSRYNESIHVRNWHYRHDPTHVCFYTDQTFEVIAERYGFNSMKLVSKSVVLLGKA